MHYILNYLCDNYIRSCTYTNLLHCYVCTCSLNTNIGVSGAHKSFSNNTDANYYVQTFASKVTFNGSAQQNVSLLNYVATSVKKILCTCFNVQVSARPGQNFRLYVQPIDEFGQVTFATLRLTDVKDNPRPQSFNPSIVTSDTQRDPTVW